MASLWSRFICFISHLGVAGHPTFKPPQNKPLDFSVFQAPRQVMPSRQGACPGAKPQRCVWTQFQQLVLLFQIVAVAVGSLIPPIGDFSFSFSLSLSLYIYIKYIIYFCSFLNYASMILKSWIQACGLASQLGKLWDLEGGNGVILLDAEVVLSQELAPF